MQLSSLYQNSREVTRDESRKLECMWGFGLYRIKDSSKLKWGIRLIPSRLLTFLPTYANSRYPWRIQQWHLLPPIHHTYIHQNTKWKSTIAKQYHKLRVPQLIFKKRRVLVASAQNLISSPRIRLASPRLITFPLPFGFIPSSLLVLMFHPPRKVPNRITH